jgi:hypothetical protein
MSDLSIDGDSLREAARRIREVVDSFATAGSDAHDAADYVGHGGLASRVREFADGWDIHRGKFSDELRQMADMLEAVDDTFTDLDNHIAAKVREATATVAAALVQAGPTGIQDPGPPLTGGHGA